MTFHVKPNKLSTMYINSNIKYLRQQKGKTRKQFSNEIGIGTRTIESYEAKRANPPLRKLGAIADYFKITIDDLLRKDFTKID